MVKMDGDTINKALETLGILLGMRGSSAHIVVIGGGNLIYAGLVSRTTTRDLDIVGAIEDGRVVKFRPLPVAFVGAARDVAQQFGLPADWINLGPDSLLDKGLPDGFTSRLETERYGALVVSFAGRLDLIALKVYAAANPSPRDPDSGRHLQDLDDLQPSADELAFARAWMAGWAADDLLARADRIIGGPR
jgi:hypothetical protein